MPTGIPLADAAQTALGLGEAISGLINEGNAKKEATRLAASRPQYQVDPLNKQDLNLAESELGSNVSAGEKAYATLNNGQFSSAMGSALKAGGNANSIGTIYGSNDDGRLRLATMRDNLRLNQIQNYVRASQATQDANQTAWQINKFAPWQDKAQANSAARAGAQKQVSDGFQTFGAGLGNADQASREQKQFSVPNYATGIPAEVPMTNQVGSTNMNAPTIDNPQYYNAGTLTNRTEPFPTYNQ